MPLLNIFYAYILLIILSLYDMYAVWKSKHMVKMAKFQTRSGIFAGLLIPYGFKKAKKKGMVKVKTAVLGGGDIGFPLLFAGTILVFKGWLPALIVTACATIALILFGVSVIIAITFRFGDNLFAFTVIIWFSRASYEVLGVSKENLVIDSLHNLQISGSTQPVNLIFITSSILILFYFSRYYLNVPLYKLNSKNAQMGDSFTKDKRAS